MKLRPAHFKILIVASLGQFLGQGLATLVGIVIPLLQLASVQGLPSALQGVLGCISLIGIMIGSAVIGNMSDRYGYLLLFRLCPVVCGAAALSVVLFPSVWMLTAGLFIMGFSIGGEYSLDPNYISELMPSRWKVFMVGVAKALASAGSAFVAIVCYVVLSEAGSAKMWSLLMLIIVGICALMVLTRIGFAQSPAWLVSRGRRQEAEVAVKKMLGADVALPEPSSAGGVPKAPSTDACCDSIWRFVATRLRKIMLTGIPWACEGLGVYGIGIFLPILIMAFKLDTLTSDASQIERISRSVELTFVLCVVMMVGFIIGLSLLRRFSHLKIQVAGFCLSALGLGVLLTSYELHWHAGFAIGGFVLFELALNAGPHLITFILPSQVFSVSDRGTGAGIAASIGKSGAVAGAFFIPLILDAWGASGVLIVSIIVMAVGALITRICNPTK